MAGLHDFTTKEVLNKVLLDSSGDAVSAFSHTTQEALNAVLDTANSRLNVAIEGGTISGNLTISGDLTVQGGGLLNYDETVVGNLSLTKDVAGEFAGLYIINSADDAGTAPSVASIFGLGDTAGNYRQGGAIKVIKEASWTVVSATRDSAMTFWTSLNGTVAEKMRITSAGQVILNATPADLRAAPTLGFGDGNTGFYEEVDNRLCVSINGAKKLEFGEGGDYLTFGHSSGFPSIDTGAIATATNPGFLIRRSDVTDGIGGVVGTVSLITNSLSRLIVDDNSRISLSNNDGGGNNTVFGKLAGNALHATSVQSVMIGEEAGNTLDTATTDRNVFIGYQTGKALSSGIIADTVAIGNQSLYGVGVRACNASVFIGASSGNGTWGGQSDYNVAIGTSTMSGAMNDANNNVAVGYSALTALTSGENNVAVGSSALKVVITGTDNVAIGFESMITNTAGQYNTAVGFKSLYTANENDNDGSVAIGYDALRLKAGTGGAQYNTTSTAVGFQAGAIESTGGKNAYLGWTAGNTVTTGTENTILGHNCDVSASGSTNQIVIGNNFSGTADNAVHIGNDTSHIRCDFNADQTWDASSDRRQKKDIKESELGLDFINDLKPCKYKYKSPSEFPEEWKAYDSDDKEPMGGSDKYYYGFIAQEVKESIDKYDASDYGAWNVDDDGRQRVSREQFVVSLVKSVQELSAKVEELEAKLSK